MSAPLAFFLGIVVGVWLAATFVILVGRERRVTFGEPADQDRKL